MKRTTKARKAAPQRKAATVATSAALQPLTKCKLYPSGRTVWIVKPFGPVLYLPAPGKPSYIRDGYVVTDAKGNETFSPAGELVASDAPHNYSHLRLVVGG